MFWHKDVIESFGFKSVDEFVEFFVRQHNNCCVKFAPDGVYLDYDFDSNIVDEFNKIGCTSFQVTADELKEIMNKE